MFVVKHAETGKYVRKKTRYWHPRAWTDDIMQAQVYKSKGAVKNSLGRNSSNIPGRNKKTLPPFLVIVPVVIKEVEQWEL